MLVQMMRPPKIMLNVRIRPEYKVLWQEAADQDDSTLTRWIWTRLNAAARKELGRGH